MLYIVLGTPAAKKADPTACFYLMTHPESPINPISAPGAPLKKKLTSPCENSGVFSSFGMFVGCFHIYKPPGVS